MYTLNFPSLLGDTSAASFGPASAPATGVASTGTRSSSVRGAAVGAAGGSVPNVLGEHQAGAIGASTPSVAGQHAVGATPAVATTVGVPAQQQRTVNGQLPASAPAHATPAPAVNNAAIKTPI